MSDATMSAVLQRVIDDTNRLDQIAVLQRRILRAALFWHRKERWKKDVIEQLYVFPNPNTSLVPNSSQYTGANSLFLNSLAAPNLSLNVQQIDTTLLKRFRNLWYLRKWITVDQFGNAILDPTTGLPGTVANGDLFERAADTMFDGYGYDVTDVYYKSGNNITINSSTPLSQVYIGYYCDPFLDFENIDQTPEIVNGNILWAGNNTVSWIIDNYPDLISATVKAKRFADMGKTEEQKSANEEMQSEALSLFGENVRLGER